MKIQQQFSYTTELFLHKFLFNFSILVLFMSISFVARQVDNYFKYLKKKVKKKNIDPHYIN